jgi:hypothetical protein
MAGIGDYLATTSEHKMIVWMYIGHAAFAFTFLYAAFICALSDRIELTIELIKVTAKAMQESTGTILIPFIQWIFGFGLWVYFLVGAALIITTDWDPDADLQEALKNTNLDQTSKCPASLCRPDIMNVTAGLTSHSEKATDSQYVMLAFYTFGFYWASNYLAAVKTMIVAAAVAEVFWT